jgi:hypothetical protein
MMLWFGMIALATAGAVLAGVDSQSGSASPEQMAGLPGKGLQFSQITPVAPQGLGGLVSDHFSNGRLFATVAWHGGLANVSYWGNQRLGASGFFNGKLDSAFFELFRAGVGVGTKRYYLPLEHTKLYPFGLGGQSRVGNVDFTQELLLLPDALVQRFGVVHNPENQPVLLEMFHQEKLCRQSLPNRLWTDFKFNSKLNAMIATCTDGDPQVTTWIGVGCDVPMEARVSYNGFKLYFTSGPLPGSEASFFLVFAATQSQLEHRLEELSKNVNQECDGLMAGYEMRLRSRPRIDVGNPVLDSAFGQYPEVINFMKVPDHPGAVRATQAGYFVWGWDCMTDLIASPLANEPEFTRSTFQFLQDSYNPDAGIPHSFTTAFQPDLKAPFPAQAQFIASLYHYLAITGDLELARKVMPTCKRILDRCREHRVQNTGLVSGKALWPDFPEAMGENGHDISSLNNSLLYQALRSMEYIAGALGDPKLAAECGAWAKSLRVNFIKYLYDSEQGYFITSCSSEDFSPRKHYGCQVIFWITPFARELVSHDPERIASFMDKNLRSANCLLSLPQWDTAWMADGNQLGSSFPTADYFYLNVHKLLGDPSGLKSWLGDVEWFWRYHTAPEAFTPEVENEDEFGPDNHGCKQLQTLSAWYSCLYLGVAGLDFDHEGLTLTPWSQTPVDIRGLPLRGVSVDLKITGAGPHIASLKLNGATLPAGSRKIAWSAFLGPTARLELARGEQAPNHPVIVRADGLRIASVSTNPARLTARIEGDMTGEVVVQTSRAAHVRVNGQPFYCIREPATGTIGVPFANTGPMILEVVE